MSARRWRLVRAAPIAIPASVRRFNQRRRQRRMASARPWVIAAAVLAVLGLLAWTVFGSSLLGVSRIEVRGGDYVSAEAIRRAVAVPSGTPLALLDRKAAARRVERLAPVKSARVDREWPRTLVVSVTLRHPVAAVPLPDSSYELIDAGGVPFRAVGSRLGLPVIRTGAADLAGPGTAAALRAAAAVLESLPPALSDRLARVDAPSDTQVTLILSDGRSIVWGDASANAEKARVALVLLDQPGKIIDVSAPSLVTVQ